MNGASYQSSKAALSRKIGAVHDAEDPVDTLREEEERKDQK